MLAYSLYTQFLSYKKRKTKIKETHSLLCELSPFSRQLRFCILPLWLYSEFTKTIRTLLSQTVFICVLCHTVIVTPSSLLFHLYWFQMPAVLLGFCHLSVSHPLRYVLILYRNSIEFADRPISHKNEMSRLV